VAFSEALLVYALIMSIVSRLGDLSSSSLLTRGYPFGASFVTLDSE